MIKKKVKNKKVKNLNIRNKNYKRIILKIIIIFFIIFLLKMNPQNQIYSNSITLVAVNKNSQNNDLSGSTIPLNLKITKGTGKIYINLNKITAKDTQTSILNSNKNACKTFNLNCENYNFYYSFQGNSLFLKGPSASVPIAILTAKTIQKEKINPKITITGMLTSGGIVGKVGGIKYKIQAAIENKMDLIIIPKFSKYNKNLSRNISISEVTNLIEAYNKFGKKFTTKIKYINSTQLQNQMKLFSKNLCNRTKIFLKLENKTNLSKINQIFFNQSLKSYKIQLKIKNRDFYSKASLCFSSNLNLQILNQTISNQSINDINKNIVYLKNEINQTLLKLNSKKYINNIKTTNDLYVYLILQNRINKAKRYINNISKINQTNRNSSLILYSYSIERYKTIFLWQKLITHQGQDISYNSYDVLSACNQINNQIQINNNLIQPYNLSNFKTLIKKQISDKNPYLCIYNGMQLLSKINTILNSVGITANQEKQYAKILINQTTTQITKNIKTSFPLIPFIYFEYSKNLYLNKNYISSILYSNYALTFSDLNIYLNQNKENQKFTFNQYIENLSKSILFISILLILLIFI